MLRRYLVRRGARPADADDLIQECALRVLAHEPTFDDAEDLARWCLPVVRNLHVDAHRRDLRHVVTEDVPEQVQLRDVVQEHVLQRVELQSVLHAMHQLTPSDREAIVGGVHADARPVDRREAVKLNVRRHRARQRLAAMIAALTGVFGSLCRRGTGAVAPAGSMVLAGFVVAAGVVGGSLTLLPSPDGSAAVLAATRHAAAAPAASVSVGRAAPLSAARASTTVASGTARAAGRSSTELVAAPTGDRVLLTPSDTPPVADALVCVDGLPRLGQVCVTKTVKRPTASEVSEPQAVVR